jgi:hypothetical protein
MLSFESCLKVSSCSVYKLLAEIRLLTTLANRPLLIIFLFSHGKCMHYLHDAKLKKHFLIYQSI